MHHNLKKPRRHKHMHTETHNLNVRSGAHANIASVARAGARAHFKRRLT